MVQQQHVVHTALLSGRLAVLVEIEILSVFQWYLAYIIQILSILYTEEGPEALHLLFGILTTYELDHAQAHDVDYLAEAIEIEQI